MEERKRGMLIRKIEEWQKKSRNDVGSFNKMFHTDTLD
jgi:hypothetical protein